MSKHATTRTSRRTPPPPAMWLCTALPLWARVGLYAQAHHGRALRPGELHSTLDPHGSRSALSNAITRAVTEGLVTYDSTARCLYSLVREA